MSLAGTDLARHIEQTPIVDTHEHLEKEDTWVRDGPADVLADLFSNYTLADLASAGASSDAVERLTDDSDDDLDARWAPVADAWHAIQYTGYGESVRRLAKDIYGIEQIDAESLRTAQCKLEEIRRPGQRLHILRDLAHIEHVQTDDKEWACLPDPSGPDFFFYDISWVGFAGRGVDFERLAAETGVTVSDLQSLRRAMETLFDKYAPCAIAVKSQHAYNRPLIWSPPDPSEAERQLLAILRDPTQPMPLVLGDWGLARGVELAIEFGLPFKIHTGVLGGTGRMSVASVNPSHLCELTKVYPQARFVLMHAGYPYDRELIAMLKHYPNAYGDLCWTWSIDPYSSAEFVRRYLHAAPVNKLFAFGGDTRWPTSSYAYAMQMRDHLTRALQAEVEDGYLTEMQAMDVATRLMRENQRSLFDVDGTRNAVADRLALQP